MMNFDQTALDNVLKELKAQGMKFDRKTCRKITRGGAKILVNEIKTNIRSVAKSKKKHYRYSKGGENIAVYEPGNLERSIGMLPLRRTAQVYVGPRFSKGKSSGVYSGSRVDGYYAHFVEYGVPQRPATPFMRPAYDKAGAQVLSQIEKDTLKEFNKRFS